MKKIEKSEVVKLIADLKNKGYSYEELAVMIDKSAQTIWSYASPSNDRIPFKSDYEVFKRILAKQEVI